MHLADVEYAVWEVAYRVLQHCTMVVINDWVVTIPQILLDLSCVRKRDRVIMRELENIVIFLDKHLQNTSKFKAFLLIYCYH